LEIRFNKFMHKQKISTLTIAKAVGCHSNTVRLFETQGYIPQAPRSRAGYRQFSEFHIDQMRLAITTLQWPYPGGKTPVVRLVQLAANKEFHAALQLGYAYKDRVQQEIDYAQGAVRALEQWASGQPAKPMPHPLRIKDAASMLGVTADTLRNWERNGLVSIPRDSSNSYRLYNEPELSRLRVIRVLRKAGYSMMAMLRTIHQLDLGIKSDLEILIGEQPIGEDVITAADRWLATLKDQKTRAERIIFQINQMIEKYAST
jgi:DNA-binding transcriptional MerR regulator